MTIFRALGASFPFPHKVRYASGRKGFLGEFVDNLRQEFSKSQEMKDNIKKFREEAKRLEESDALQQARKKYVRDHFRDKSSSVSQNRIYVYETTFLVLFSVVEIYWGRDGEDIRGIQEDFWLSVWHC